MQTRERVSLQIAVVIVLFQLVRDSVVLDIGGLPALNRLAQLSGVPVFLQLLAFGLASCLAVQACIRLWRGHAWWIVPLGCSFILWTLTSRPQRWLDKPGGPTRFAAILPYFVILSGGCLIALLILERRGRATAANGR